MITRYLVVLFMNYNWLYLSIKLLFANLYWHSSWQMNPRLMKYSCLWLNFACYFVFRVNMHQIMVCVFCITRLNVGSHCAVKIWLKHWCWHSICYLRNDKFCTSIACPFAYFSWKILGDENTTFRPRCLVDQQFNTLLG